MFAEFRCPLCNQSMNEVGDFEDAKQVDSGKAYLQCSAHKFHRVTAVEIYRLTDTMTRRANKLRERDEKNESI